ncbi:hypothetical protein F4821DRAFT_274720 [Hypoxylon rubiginosum]|uniref:Uncharacterized protein n=1 Tax=Hypoxylon rubiginosum TaxID=110542 RepID=A0ACC0DDA5_9PEZI|nr:hypothetical protein F4821DRAFT_274720 [Hypoxylon rubiginosum]
MGTPSKAPVISIDSMEENHLETVSPPQLHSRTIVETLPTCVPKVSGFTAWKLKRDITTPLDQVNSYERPSQSIQVYETRPTHCNELQVLARRLINHFGPHLEAKGFNTSVRIDVYGLAVPLETLRANRIERCIQHQRAEFKAQPPSFDTLSGSTFHFWDGQIFILEDTTGPAKPSILLGGGTDIIGVSFKRQFLPVQQDSSENMEGTLYRNFISWQCKVDELREGKFMWCARRNILPGWCTS